MYCGDSIDIQVRHMFGFVPTISIDIHFGRAALIRPARYDAMGELRYRYARMAAVYCQPLGV